MGRTVGEKVRAGSIAEADRPALEAMAEAERALTAAAAPHVIVARLEALFRHYPASGGGGTTVWKDWLEDVGHLPDHVLADACRKWRRSDARFAPSPGQLLKLVDPDYLYRRKLAELAIKALDTARKVGA